MAPSGQRRVLFVTPEMTDFVKTGGLGEVAAALPRVLRASQDVRVLIPGYREVLRHCGPPRIVGRIEAVAGLPACELAFVELPDGLPVLVLVNAALYERPGNPYLDPHGLEWPDNDVRFATLSHAAAQIAAGRAGLRWRPELLHLNDWTCAPAAAYAHWAGAHAASVLTVHNLAYQGHFPAARRAMLGMPEPISGSAAARSFSFMELGLRHADFITTVSQNYAAQITQPEHGCGLHALLQRRAAEGRLAGIVNGIDEGWEPASDPHLLVPFDATDWREARRLHAAHVRERFGLAPGRGPLFISVSRLVHQKGVDLVCEAAPRIVAAGGQLAIIGSGEPLLERAARRLAQRFPGRIGAQVGFDETLSRRMFAGGDFLLMPSRFEPCGLSQMYAQCYGCLPLAHATGGLVDTIEDGVTGLLFDRLTCDGLVRCMQRAFRIYAEPELLDAMRRMAMRETHGWGGARARYEAVYERIAPLAVAA